MIDYNEILTVMFGNKFQITEKNNIITGHGTYAEHAFALFGVVNEAMLDNQMSLDLADFVIQQPAKTNFLIILDTGGQQATHQAELLGLNRYYAHLIKALHFKRHQECRVFALVIGKALGGAFIATALNAQRIYALPSAQISVMWLEAMSRVTKIPLAKLQELSKTSPIFAPGAENFYLLGAVAEILSAEKIMSTLINTINLPTLLGDWRSNGFERGGRKLSAPIVEAVLRA